MKKKSLNIIVGVLMVGALFGSLTLVQNNQDTRRGAFFAGTSMELLPNTIENSVGNPIPVKVWVTTESGAKISSADIVVCYDDKLEITDLSNDIVLNQQALQSKLLVENLPGATVIGAKKCTRIAAIVKPETKPEDLKSGRIELLTITFTAVSLGDGEIIINKESTKIGGHNPAAGATDMAIEVKTVTGATFKIIEPEECNNLWWFDNTNLVCANKQFCGNYMYEGLRTFETKEECETNLPVPHNCDRCSKQFNYMRSSWTTIVDCELPAPEGTVITRRYDPNCNDGDNPRQCSRCSRVNDKEFVWWLREANKTCEDDPITGQTIYSAYNESCRLETGNWPILNYVIKYASIKNEANKCFVPEDWPMQVIVMGGGVTQVYNDVVSRKIEDGTFLVLTGSLVLKNFNQTENVAVFMKGPKHLQMKYAIDKQVGPYGKAGGELTLKRSIEDSPVYDFTGYPILAGDIKGNNTDEPDGIVDGYDFGEIKKRAMIHETVDDGKYLKSDLDGSCQVNSSDLVIIKETLKTKQGELY